MIHEDEVKAIDQKIADRRKFLKSAGFTGLGLAAAGFVGVGGTKALAATTSSPDIDLAILNFALNLEYLEAEFYTVATTGKRIADMGITLPAGSAPTTGGNMVNLNIPGNPSLSSHLVKIAAELTFDEQEHVRLLLGALGSSAVPKPALNLNALGSGFANVTQFLALARAFEDVGMSAYDGAAPLITSKAYLGVAAQIALTEANHSGVLRLLCAITGTETVEVDKLDIATPPRGYQYFNVNGKTALAATRTTSQVLAVVYGSYALGTTKGGFYPNGMNGAINTVGRVNEVGEDE